jgi:chromosome segregation ATPase
LAPRRSKRAGFPRKKSSARSRVLELEAQMEQHFDQLHALETARDGAKAEAETYKTGLERAKQHVGVLQARRDVMREEINRLREKLGFLGRTCLMADGTWGMVG